MSEQSDKTSRSTIVILALFGLMAALCILYLVLELADELEEKGIGLIEHFGERKFIFSTLIVTVGVVIGIIMLKRTFW